jgi:hypothetical protein
MQGFVVSHLNELLFVETEHPQNKLKEFPPPPNNKSFPQKINKITFHRILIT